jgi:hypothetical protein
MLYGDIQCYVTGILCTAASVFIHNTAEYENNLLYFYNFNLFVSILVWTMVVNLISDTVYKYPHGGKRLNTITANCHTKSIIVFIHLKLTYTQDLSYVILNFK